MRIRTVVLLAILAVACSKQKDEQGAAKSAAPAPSAAASPSSSPGGAPAASFVPESILVQLGDSRTVAAVDFTRLDLANRLKPLVPDYLGCVREVAGNAGILVVGLGDSTVGFITKLPQSATKKCMATLGIGSTPGPNGAEHFAIGDDQLSLVWRGDTAVVAKVGDKPVTGTLAPTMRSGIAALPPSAIAWLVDDRDQKGIKHMAVWIDVSDTTFGLHGRLEGSQPGAAKKAAEQFLEGVREGASQKGIAVDESWLKMSSTELDAAFDATFPLTALLGL